MKNRQPIESIQEGTIILHYQILDRITLGATAVVYKAQDTRLDLPVVLKFLRDDSLVHAKAKERFLREASAFSALDHPNIASSYGLKDTENGLFLVLEYVEGNTLGQVLGEQKLTFDVIVDIMMNLLEALAYAHNKGIIHRDIKPSNILIDTQGRVKLTDFGLALLDFRSRLTESGQSIGTPFYMSPEQAMGRRVDDRSDIFSLGIVLFEMIHGTLPFTGDSMLSVMYAIINDRPVFQSDYEEMRLGALARIAAKAMIKDPDGRYKDAEAMKCDFDQLLDHQHEGEYESSMEMVGVAPDEDVTSVEKEAGWRRIKVLRIVKTVAIPLLAAGVLTLLLLTWQNSPNPVDYEIRGNVFVALGAEGEVAWSFEFQDNIEGIDELQPEYRKNYLKFVDIDEDGKNEVIFAPFTRFRLQSENDSPRNTLYCLEDDGQLKWQFTVGRELSFNSGADITKGCYEISYIDAHDFDKDGQSEILVVSHQCIFFPCQVLLLDNHGDLKGEYWNSGYIASFANLDIDGNGTDELILGGINNEYKNSCLIVLDPTYMMGSSPQDNEAFTADGLERGTEMYYVRMSKSDLGRIRDEAFPIKELAVVNDGLLATVHEKPPEGVSGPYEYFIQFSIDLNPIELGFSTQFGSSFSDALEKGYLKEDLSNTDYGLQVRNQLLSLKYWNGDKWVSEPERNRIWREEKEIVLISS